MMIHPHRRHALWYAFFLHRASGVLLALFLPVHFWILSLALNESARLDRLLEWTDMPIVKLAEFGLVFLLGVHAFGGLRILALEWLPWSAKQKSLAAAALAASFVISGTFLLRAI